MTQSHTPTPYHRNIKPATKYTTIWAGRNEHIAYMATQGRNPEQVEKDMDFIVHACNTHDDLVAGLEGVLRFDSCWNDRKKALEFAIDALARAKAVR